MKSLLDLLPLMVFFAGYYGAKAEAEMVGGLLGTLLGYLHLTDPLPEKQIPLLFATLLAMVATIVQVLLLLLLRHKVDKILWVSLVIIVLMGIATLVFHDPEIIKWRSTIIDWIFGLTLLISEFALGRNLIRAMLQGQIELPDVIWSRLNLSWVVFFLCSGALNLYVAFNYSEDTWVNFNTVGGIVIMVVFLVGQGFYLMRHLQDPEHSE